MDYKETCAAMAWHARNTKMNGTEAKVLMLILTDANYKTSEYHASYDDIAEAIMCSVSAVKKAIKSLIASNAIFEKKSGSGRSPSIYKLRTEKALKIIFNVDFINPEFDEWENERDSLFGEVEKELYKIGLGCDKCNAEIEKHGEDAKCTEHEYYMQELKKTQEYRMMLVWDEDHPKPKRTIIKPNTKTRINKARKLKP